MYRLRPLSLTMATAIVLPLCAAAPTVAQTPAAHVTDDDGLFRLPSLRTAAPVLGGALLLFTLDGEIQEGFQNGGLQGNSALQTIAGTFKPMGGRKPAAIAAGAFVVGWVTGNETLEDIGFHTAESVILASTIGAGIKFATGRARPFMAPEDPDEFEFGRGARDHGHFASFPSGHTTAAFALAAALGEESEEHWPGAGRYVKPLAYGSATLVGLSRMYDDAHWATDVLIGAALGTTMGLRVVRRAHDDPDAFRLEPVVITTESGATAGIGGTFRF